MFVASVSDDGARNITAIRAVLDSPDLLPRILRLAFSPHDAPTPVPQVPPAVAVPVEHPATAVCTRATWRDLVGWELGTLVDRGCADLDDEAGAAALRRVSARWAAAVRAILSARRAARLDRLRSRVAVRLERRCAVREALSYEERV